MNRRNLVWMYEQREFGQSWEMEFQAKRNTEKLTDYLIKKEGKKFAVVKGTETLEVFSTFEMACKEKNRLDKIN